MPVKRLVRGHDHVPDRWQEYPEYADNGVPVLTINALGRRSMANPRGEMGGNTRCQRCAPRQDRLPEVVLLPLEAAEVDRAFARLPPSESPTNAQRSVEGGQ